MSNRNLCFTLAFNLVSETAGAVDRLYQQNDRNDFIHVIADCDFPLLEGDKIPNDIELAKQRNSEVLQRIAEKYNSGYVKIQNGGVSQNWQTMYEYFKPEDGDVMTCVEPDEIAIESGWIKALGGVIRADGTIGYAAPTLIDNKNVLKSSRYAQLKNIGGYNVYDMVGSVNYGLLSISGKLMNKMGGLAPYHATPIYGNIESVLITAIKKYGMKWVILRDYTQAHTNVPKLYREWKDDCIFGKFKDSQIHFEDWLIKKKNGEA